MFANAAFLWGLRKELLVQDFTGRVAVMGSFSRVGSQGGGRESYVHGWTSQDVHLCGWKYKDGKNGRVGDAWNIEGGEEAGYQVG